MFEEKDFLMKQIKNIAKGLGKLLGVEEIKDIIFMDENQARALTDKELESIVAVAKVENIQANAEWSNDKLANSLGITTDRLNDLYENEETAETDEIEKFNAFIQSNIKYL